MNESVNDWIKRVVLSLWKHRITSSVDIYILLTIKADLHILPWVHVALCMVYIVLTFFVSIFIFRRRIGGIESQHRSSRDVITRHSYGYTSNRFVLFFKIFSPAVYQKPCYLWSFDNTTKYPSAFSKSGDH